MRMSEIHDAMLRASQHVDLMGEPKEPEPVATLRDQFAMAALPALVTISTTTDPLIIAHNSYGIADAMLKAREEK